LPNIHLCIWNYEKYQPFICVEEGNYWKNWRSVNCGGHRNAQEEEEEEEIY